MKRGISVEKIVQLVQSPIVMVKENGIQKEVYLYDYLIGDSYSESYEKLSKVVSIQEA